MADADAPGRKHAEQVAAGLFGKVESLKVLELPKAKDLSEWMEQGGTRERFLDLIRSAGEWLPPSSNTSETETPLIALSVEELLAREITPREMLLDPHLPETGLAML